MYREVGRDIYVLCIMFVKVNEFNSRKTISNINTKGKVKHNII